MIAAVVNGQQPLGMLRVAHHGIENDRPRHGQPRPLGWEAHPEPRKSLWEWRGKRAQKGAFWGLKGWPGRFCFMR